MVSGISTTRTPSAAFSAGGPRSCGALQKHVVGGTGVRADYGQTGFVTSPQTPAWVDVIVKATESIANISRAANVIVLEEEESHFSFSLE